MGVLVGNSLDVVVVRTSMFEALLSRFEITLCDCWNVNSNKEPIERLGTPLKEYLWWLKIPEKGFVIVGDVNLPHALINTNRVDAIIHIIFNSKEPTSKSFSL